jgi:ABC-type glycerol-3-phosphate transport system permease component
LLPFLASYRTATIPPVLIFFLIQQHFNAGLTAGSESD